MIVADNLLPGQVYSVSHQGMGITPVTIKVTIKWISPDQVHYTLEGSSELKETSLERFLHILNKSPWVQKH